ncbi:type VII secretion integral membrane protein EccD [Kibdelosporangium philippinense]|uniref:Type VII secretion integral membrane protein EccD n=1 Tax=Kibdelosporangium philippinense TaxID=211113 RepID=A0ABS8Z3T8_9PSEU|nr:type VII secretion integral membrane protein EccD [Kibdelosporangium philippinense]MCE7001599.1 type VII secretion integral membrane protein EccD [Kibdelosporangium philippinense]
MTTTHHSTGGYCRIRLAGPRTRVDLAVPSGVPLAALLPTLLKHAVDEKDEGEAGGWTLSTIDGGALDPAASLTASGVREGDLLVLHPANDRNPPPLYDDVVEVIGENSIDSAWGTKQTRAACAVLITASVLGGLAAVAAGKGILPGILAAVACVLLLLGGGALSRALGDVPAGILGATLAIPAGAVAAASLLGGTWGAGHALLAFAVVLLVSALGPVVVGGGDAVFAAFTMIGVFGCLGSLIVVLDAGSPAAAAAVVAPLALAMTTLMPVLALRISRFPRPQLPRTVDDLANTPGQVEFDTVLQRVRRARLMLSGLVAGCHATIAVGIAILAAAGDAWAWSLAGVLFLLMLLRARLFREIPQVASPILAAVLALPAGAGVAVAQAAGNNTMLLGVVLPILLVGAAIATLVGIASGRHAPNPRTSRLLDIIETTLLLTVVPLALAVWGIYRLLLDLGG